MNKADDASNTVAMPLLLSLMAGLSTCLGAAVVFCANKSSDKPPLSHQHLAFSLSLAASVMITVSVASILPESFHGVAFGSREFMERCLSFSIGCILYLLLSKCAFPEPDDILGLDAVDHDFEASSQDDEPTDRAEPFRKVMNHSTESKKKGTSAFKRKRSSNVSVLREESNLMGNETGNSDLEMPLLSLSRSSSSLLLTDDDKSREEVPKVKPRGMFSGSDLATPEARRAWRVAMLLFVSLAVHNFPEGLAVAASTLHSHSLGVTTTIAIALHNIPEGVAVAVPCLAARPDAPCLAFGLATLSGLAEPLGAAVALLVLPNSDTMAQNTAVSPFWNMKNILAFVAGIMIMVALRELFPEALRHSKEGKMAAVAGTLIGMVVMLASDAVLEG